MPDKPKINEFYLFYPKNEQVVKKKGFWLLFSAGTDRFAIFGGGTTGILLEFLAEVAGGGKTAFGSNFRDGPIIVPEIFPGN